MLVDQSIRISLKMENQLIVAIDPAGIGQNGITVYLKKGTEYIKYLYYELAALNPVDGAEKISNLINNLEQKYDLKMIFVAVELLHNGIEKFYEVKATRELIGILRFLYKERFCGFLPYVKNTHKIVFKNELKQYSSHIIDSRCILEAAFEQQPHENFEGKKYESNA